MTSVCFRSLAGEMFNVLQTPLRFLFLVNLNYYQYFPADAPCERISGGTRRCEQQVHQDNNNVDEQPKQEAFDGPYRKNNSFDG